MKQSGKNGKRMVATVMAVGMLAVGVAAFASEAFSPADIAAEVTGKTVAEVQALKAEEGTTYGAIADGEGVLDEFSEKWLEVRKAILAQRVSDGVMTQEQADEMLATMKDHVCDGTASGAHIGQAAGAAFGRDSALRDGTGLGQGQGLGQGRMLRDGTGEADGIARAAGGKGMGRHANR